MEQTILTLPGTHAVRILRSAVHQHLQDRTSTQAQSPQGTTQLLLPGIPEEVEGIRMGTIRDYFVRLLAIEEAMDVYREQQRELWEEVKDHALPSKTMRSALKIARARHKRDTSMAVLNACVEVALTLLPPEEGEEHDQSADARESVDMTTGEIRES